MATTHYYYVDESGDLTLFNQKGKTIVGSEGCSRIFMIGVLQLPDPKLAKEKLEFLRQELLSDPHLSQIPSMQPIAKKTAIAFHAKNDHESIRQKVFNLLPSFGCKVCIAIRRKKLMADKYYKIKDTRFQTNLVCDDLVKRLFKNLLHKADENKIIFAKLGKSERREALKSAITRAKENFNNSNSQCHDKPTTIEVKQSSDDVGLQIIDYYLWALQRLYERQDDHYFLKLQRDYRLIMDLDDTRSKPYGEWYSNFK